MSLFDQIPDAVRPFVSSPRSDQEVIDSVEQRLAQFGAPPNRVVQLELRRRIADELGRQRSYVTGPRQAPKLPPHVGGPATSAASPNLTPRVNPPRQGYRLAPGEIDPGGLSQSSGISAALRQYGMPFSMEIGECQQRFLRGDRDAVDQSGRSYYRTAHGPDIVFTGPTKPPWFAIVSLPSERF
jgi:hypothetical protein